MEDAGVGVMLHRVALNCGVCGSSVIVGLALAAKPDGAMVLVSEMGQSGVAPNMMTYSLEDVSKVQMVVSCRDQTTEAPEVVLTPAMAASVYAHLYTMAAVLYHEQMKGRLVDWNVPEEAFGQGGKDFMVFDKSWDDRRLH
ncbi:hypothetical protein ACQ4PT_025203 [Festuca glaucescens]